MSSNDTTNTPVTVWQHSRKGRIVGRVTWQDDVWMNIRLDGDHEPRFMSEAYQGKTYEDGAIITVRKSLMREIAA